MRCVGRVQIKAHAACGVTGRVQCFEGERAKWNHLTVDQLNRCSADVTAFGCGGLNAKMFGQQTCAGNVICVGMGF